MARQDEGSSVKDKIEDFTSDGSKSKEILTSAAVSAIGALAAAKGPDLFRKVAGATQEKGDEEAEELGEKAMDGAKGKLADLGPGGKIASKLLGGGGKGGGGKGGGGGGKKTRRLPIQRWTDIALPVEDVYEAFTKFDQFPTFMHRVLNIEQKGKTKDKVKWSEKIWFKTREWEGEVTERRKNDRIVWKTKNGTKHKGIVSFHELAPNLTRVMVDMEFEPTGMFEKMASGLRFVKRAVQSDLARFKTYVEMQDAKGIEYRPNPKDDKDEKKDGEDGEENKDENENGDDADEATAREQKSDDEREKERKEREKARKERRKSGSR